MDDLRALREAAERARSARPDYVRALRQVGDAQQAERRLADLSRYLKATPEDQDVCAAAAEVAAAELGDRFVWERSASFGSATAPLRIALFTDRETKMAMALIPGLDGGRLVGRFLVTNRQFYWRRRRLGDDKHLPKVQLPWEGVRHWLSLHGLETLTREQWSHVVRAGGPAPAALGWIDKPDRRVFDEASANPFGLVDVVGNVWEMLGPDCAAGLSHRARVEGGAIDTSDSIARPVSEDFVADGVDVGPYGRADVGFRASVSLFRA